MKSHNFSYLPTIDHLRGLAATWIVLYHGNQLIGSWFAHDRPFTKADWQSTANVFNALIIEGHSAVSLFMVLSGFIFTYGALDKDIRYTQFIVNRLLRIFPLYIVLIVISMASGASAFSIGKLLSTLLPLANVDRLDGPFLAMSWAIAVEFQFYLIFPFLLSAMSRNATKSVLALIATAVLLRILMVSLYASPRDIGYWHLTGRIDQFVCGMAAAVAIRHAPLSAPSYKWLLASSTLAAIGLLYLFHRLAGC